MEKDTGVRRRYTIRRQKTLQNLPALSMQERHLLELVAHIGTRRTLQVIAHHLPEEVSLNPFSTLESNNVAQPHIPVYHTQETTIVKNGSIKEWQQILTLIQTKISPPSFETWFKNIVALIGPENELIVKCENELQCDWLSERYHNIISAAVIEVMGKSYKLTFKSVG